VDRDNSLPAWLWQFASEPTETTPQNGPKSALIFNETCRDVESATVEEYYGDEPDYDPHDHQAHALLEDFMDDRAVEPVSIDEHQQEPARTSLDPVSVGAADPKLRTRVFRQLRTNVAYLLLTIGGLVSLGLMQWLLSWSNVDRGARFLRIAMPLFALVCLGAGLVLGVRTLARAGGCFRASGGMGPLVILKIFGATLMGLAVVAMAIFVSLMPLMGFSRGRQIRRLGKVLLPGVEEGGSWSDLSMSASAPLELRLALAEQWRENGRTEHASVAAFARLTLQLMSLGAPPKLIAESQRDGLDEIRHTELCFSVARSFDGQTQSPGDFPAARRSPALSRFRTMALSQLAVESLVEGALQEGLSARIIAGLAKTCPLLEVRGVLREIAADEGRHAAHGWDVVEWCYREGGAPVGMALRAAVWAMPKATRLGVPAAAQSGTWERYGIHGKQRQMEAFQCARADLVRRVAEITASA